MKDTESRKREMNSGSECEPGHRKQQNRYLTGENSTLLADSDPARYSV